MSKSKVYRVVQNEGKISFRVEEMWDGGIKRGPYGSKEAAVAAEENIARNEGFLNELELEGVVAEERSALESFKKEDEETWLCTEGCSIEINDKEIVFTEGQKFSKGTRFMGIDVVEWLENKSKS